MLLKSFWVVLPKTLKMGQISVPETLVIHQKLKSGYNAKTFKQDLIYYKRIVKFQLKFHATNL